MVHRFVVATDVCEFVAGTCKLQWLMLIRLMVLYRCTVLVLSRDGHGVELLLAWRALGQMGADAAAVLRRTSSAAT